MKRFLAIPLFLFSISAIGSNVAALFSYATFNTPTNEPYIETYLSVFGKSVRYTPVSNGAYQAAIDVQILFKQGDEIKSFKKYSLLSPLNSDSLNPLNFIDQQRFSLAKGIYDIELSIADKNKAGSKPFVYSQKIEIGFPDESISISDIEFVESEFNKAKEFTVLTKAGYDLIPYISYFMPESKSKLAFYCEIYNTPKVIGQNERFVVNYYIENFETGSAIKRFTFFNKQQSLPVNTILADMPIDQLPSGKYNLVVEVKDKNNAVVTTKRAYFQRKNAANITIFDDLAALSTNGTFVSKISLDSIREYIRCIRPISTESEKSFEENRLKGNDVVLMRQFFLNFWITRNNSDPEKAWNNYLIEVSKVNKLFSTMNGKGYDTDRGRVYLMYGPPNIRSEMPYEPSAYPYEIWQYYHTINNQSNRKFVFMNSDMVSNNFKLIHSDARGELQDPNWQLRLHERDTRTYNPDVQAVPDYFGGHSTEIFQNPR